MYLLTLSNLNQTVQPNQLQKPSLVPNYLQQHLQLLVKQILMGLPVEPILNNYPQLQQWVNELKELSPTLFLPQRKLFVDIPIQAKLHLKKQGETVKNSSPSPSFKVIQVPASVGFVKGRPKLFEWAIRHPVMTWEDRVKLWVAVQFFKIEPEKLQLIVLALHPTQPAQKVKFVWDTKQHRQTKNWLRTQIHSQTISEFVSFGYSLGAKPELIATAINFDEIDELKL
ncbi:MULTISPECIES: hypothetical protein [unclassified Microcoleus]|uniref:hypothetical protein n=1 Tax=unclassified Microcoleus TaxID=2642155 RepID=UPI002FCECF2B